MAEYLAIVSEILAMPEMPSYLNITGLILDIAGVIILFKFGLPADIRRDGVSLVSVSGVNQTEKDKAARYDRWSLLGLFALVFGFMAQALGSAAYLFG